MRLASLSMLTALALACGGGRAAEPAPPAAGPPPATTAERELAAAIDAFYGPHMAFRPNLAIELGLHHYDGKVPDRSPGGASRRGSRSTSTPWSASARPTCSAT